MEPNRIDSILQTQKRELQKPELTHLKSGDEAKFEVALQSKKIQESSFEEVKEILRKVMLKIGLRAQNLPNDIEKLVLYEHIVENYGRNKLDEVSLAFDMAINWKLGLEDVSCYENFSCAYFSMIMNAYQKWANEVFNHIKPTEVIEQRIFTEEENDDKAREDVERQYQLFLKKVELKGLAVNSEILQKDGLLLNGEDVFNFFIRKAEKQATHIYVQGE